MPRSSVEAPTGRRRLLAGTVVAGIGLLVGLVALTDGRALWGTISRISPVMLLPPVGLGLLSYGAMARSYQGIASAAGSRLPFRTWLRMTFVSNTANYLVTSAGLSGFAVRMLLLAQEGVSSGRAVVISLVQTFLTNLTLSGFILAGFAHLVLRQRLEGAPLTAAATAVGVFVGLLLVFVVLGSHRVLRRRALACLADTVDRLLRRLAPARAPSRRQLLRFVHNLNEGVEFLLARKASMLVPAAWITFDWVLTLGIIWVAFRSVGHPIPLGLVLIGFGVGVVLSLVGIIPGGLGLMEGSMTAVYVSLGVPLEPTVVAVIIFRFAYYVVPLLVSVFLFRGLLRQVVRPPAPGV